MCAAANASTPILKVVDIVSFFGDARLLVPLPETLGASKYSVREGIKHMSPTKENRRPNVMRRWYSDHSADMNGPLRNAMEDRILNIAWPAWTELASERTRRGRDTNSR